MLACCFNDRLLFSVSVVALPKITADRVQLQQVLMNLILNGIEAMKDTGGVLTVKTGRAECGQVLISVSDTGVGLPAGRADDIFNAFFTTKPQGSGTGDQPFYRGIAWWPFVGHIQRWTRRDVPLYLARGFRGNKPFRGCRVIRHSAEWVAGPIGVI